MRNNNEIGGNSGCNRRFTRTNLQVSGLNVLRKKIKWVLKRVDNVLNKETDKNDKKGKAPPPDWDNLTGIIPSALDDYLILVNEAHNAFRKNKKKITILDIDNFSLFDSFHDNVIIKYNEQFEENVSISNAAIFACYARSRALNASDILTKEYKISKKDKNIFQNEIEAKLILAGESISDATESIAISEKIYDSSVSSDKDIVKLDKHIKISIKTENINTVIIFNAKNNKKSDKDLLKLDVSNKTSRLSKGNLAIGAGKVNLRKIAFRIFSEDYYSQKQGHPKKTIEELIDIIQDYILKIEKIPIESQLKYKTLETWIKIFRKNIGHLKDFAKEDNVGDGMDDFVDFAAKSGFLKNLYRYRSKSHKQQSNPNEDSGMQFKIPKYKLFEAPKTTKK